MARGRRRVQGNNTDVIGYVRVSTAGQAESGLGLAAQHAALAAECDRRGWNLVHVFEDAGMSGKSLKGRPGMADALSAVDSGLGGTLMVAKLDRLSRSLHDFASLVARAQRDGWNLVALDLGIDLGTAAGEFLANVMASAAQWERRIIGQRTKEALAAKRAQGVRLGRPPVLGSAVVDRIVSSRRSGAGWTEIARSLEADRVPTAQGGRRWYPATVRSVALANGAAR